VGHHAVDTNVLVAANGRDTHADLVCRRAAVAQLIAIRSAKSLLLDAGREVLREYQARMNFAGAPGIGDEFFRWAFENQATLPLIELHHEDERGYEEFPESQELRAFDPADRKFVALVVAHGDAVVVNALDSDYSESSAGLTAAGVRILELCPHQLHDVG
jgi:hypothetical protein